MSSQWPKITSLREKAVRLAFAELPGLGFQQLMPLFDGRLNPEALWEAGPNSPEAKRLNWAPKALHRWQSLLAEGAEAIKQLEVYQTEGIKTLVLGEAAYPDWLSHSSDPPPVIYYKGNWQAEWEERIGLGVVGTRRMSDHGQQLTNRLVKGLANSSCLIVSGLAEGVDTVAHWASLEAGLPTIAVFGCGVDTIFPYRNENLAQAIVEAGGAICSEFKPGTPARAGHFPRRNRIIAGLSQAVLLVEAPFKSGAMITARLALEENRTVMAVPASPLHPNAEGPLHLIRSGAIPVWEAGHIREELSLPGQTRQLSLTQSEAGTQEEQTPYKKEASIVKSASSFAGKQIKDKNRQTLPVKRWPEPFQAILEVLSPSDPTALEALSESTKLSLVELSTQLTLMELEGLVKLLPGQHVKRLA